MSDTQKIAEIEAKADESELIGRLATDPDVRTYNRRLAVELRDFAASLKARITRPHEMVQA